MNTTLPSIGLIPLVEAARFWTMLRSCRSCTLRARDALEHVVGTSPRIMPHLHCFGTPGRPCYHTTFRFLSLGGYNRSVPSRGLRLQTDAQLAPVSPAG